jgi:hypothetical protein
MRTSKRQDTADGVDKASKKQQGRAERTRAFSCSCFKLFCVFRTIIFFFVVVVVVVSCIICMSWSTGFASRIPHLVRSSWTFFFLVFVFVVLSLVILGIIVGIRARGCGILFVRADGSFRIKVFIVFIVLVIVLLVVLVLLIPLLVMISFGCKFVCGLGLCDSVVCRGLGVFFSVIGGGGRGSGSIIVVVLVAVVVAIRLAVDRAWMVDATVVAIEAGTLRITLAGACVCVVLMNLVVVRVAGFALFGVSCGGDDRLGDGGDGRGIVAIGVLEFRVSVRSAHFSFGWHGTLTGAGVFFDRQG